MSDFICIVTGSFLMESVAAFTSWSVAFLMALLAALRPSMASESASALTLKARKSWPVDLLTCLAAAISCSSSPSPCTRLLAASQRLWVALATILAAEIRPSDHCESEEPFELISFTFPWDTNSFWALEAALIREEEAVAMDLADSMIRSSNERSSVASLCQEKDSISQTVDAMLPCCPPLPGEVSRLQDALLPSLWTLQR